MPACEYCGCKVGIHAKEILPDGSHIFVCGQSECEAQLEIGQEGIEEDADRDMIGDDVDYGLKNIGNK